MTAETEEIELVEVRLLDLPTALWAEAQEHTDGLLREFAHIAHGEADDPGSTPRRLVGLVDTLRARYGRFAAAPRREIAEAQSRGIPSVDVTYRVPAGLAETIDTFEALLDEADEFCRAGALLTLTAPPQVVRYRRWLLGEFRRQSAGEPPTPWADAAA